MLQDMFNSFKQIQNNSKTGNAGSKYSRVIKVKKGNSCFQCYQKQIWQNWVHSVV